jgi:hypothetical protein
MGTRTQSRIRSGKTGHQKAIDTTELHPPKNSISVIRYRLLAGRKNLRLLKMNKKFMGAALHIAKTGGFSR